MEDREAGSGSAMMPEWTLVKIKELNAMKIRKNWLMRPVCMLLLLAVIVSLAGCQVVQTAQPTLPDSDLTELEQIMKKYDDAGYVYEYTGEPCTITMAHWNSSGANVERAVVEAVLQGFSARYPEITVELEILQDYESTYGQRLAAGTAHDVFLVPDGAISGWAPSGKIMNLTPYIQNSAILNDLDDIYDSCLTRYQYNAATGLMGSGDQYALPKDVGPYVMYYNKDWFEAMGVELPPADRIMTMEEAIEMWQALTKYDDAGNITGYGVAGICVEGAVWSAGGDFLNETRDGFPTDEATLAGLAKGYQFIKDSYLTLMIQPPNTFSGTMSAANLFAQQKVATIWGGRWEVSTFRQLSFDWDVAYVPAFTESPTTNMYSGSVGYGISAKTTHADAAFKLVEYIASKEGQEILTATGFQIPVYESLAYDEALVAREKELGPYNYEIFVESAKMQGYGLWQYRRNQIWKVNGYDIPSEYLVSYDPATEITVEEFLARAKELVNANIR